MTTDSAAPERLTLQSTTVIDTALRLALVAALVYACQSIVAPFVGILLWATVLAVMLYPLHRWLRRQPGLTNGRSAFLLGFFGVAILLVPASIAAESIGTSAFDTFTAFQNHTLEIPPPPARVATHRLNGSTSVPGPIAAHHVDQYRNNSKCRGIIPEDGEATDRHQREEPDLMAARRSRSC